MLKTFFAVAALSLTNGTYVEQARPDEQAQASSDAIVDAAASS